MVSLCIAEPSDHLSAMVQLLVIPMSLVKEVWPLCKSPICCKPFVVVTVVYAIVIILGSILGPAHKANILHVQTGNVGSALLSGPLLTQMLIMMPNVFSQDGGTVALYPFEMLPDVMLVYA